MIQPSPARLAPESCYAAKADEGSQGSSAVPDTQPTQQDAFAGDGGDWPHHPYQDPNAWGKLVWEDTTRELVGEVVIGRRPTCSIVINDVRVSGIHCKLIPPSAENSSPMVVDLSANGTFLNNELIGKENRSVLSHGDRISLLRMREGAANHSFVFLDWKRNPPSAEEQVLGRDYHVDRVLGTGNFSVVKEGLHRKTGKKVAIKIIEKRKFWNVPKTKEQILREVEILKTIQHPNVISVIDALDTPSHMYIVLELASGGELFDRLMKGCCEENEARVIMRQIVDGVAYLHEKGIAHRDLKPENILLENSGPNPRVKISDFGLAKIVGEREMMTTLCGTPQYVAPEIIKQGTYPDLVEKGYGLAVDIWSMGVILYVLLSGSPPFHEEKAISLFRQIETAAYDFPPDQWRFISPEAIDLIRKMLVTDPRARLTITQVQQHPWLAGGNETGGLSQAKNTRSSKRRAAVSSPTTRQKTAQLNLPSSSNGKPRKKSKIISQQSNSVSSASLSSLSLSPSGAEEKESAVVTANSMTVTTTDIPTAPANALVATSPDLLADNVLESRIATRTRSSSRLAKTNGTPTVVSRQSTQMLVPATTKSSSSSSSSSSRRAAPKSATPKANPSTAEQQPKRLLTTQQQRKTIVSSPTIAHIPQKNNNPNHHSTSARKKSTLEMETLEATKKPEVDTPPAKFKFPMPSDSSPSSQTRARKRLSYSER